jgi:hypothetical protein
MYILQAGAVGSVFAAALAKVSTVAMPPAVAAQNIGVGPCRGGTCGDKLEAMARIAPSQPNEAVARIAPRSLVIPIVNINRPKLVFSDYIRNCSRRFK